MPSLIIENATIVTMNAQRDVLAGAALAVEGARIAAVGPTQEVRAQFPAAGTIDGRGQVVLPGLINAHTHVSMSLQRGVTLAMPDAIYRVMWPVEKSLTAEDIYVGALLGGAEALRAGSTTVVDHYFQMDQVARATTQLGLRGVLGQTIMSRLGPFAGPGELEAGIDFVRRWQGRHPLVTPWLAPHATETVAKEWLLQLRQAASDEGVGLHLHLAQSPRELAYIRETYGMGCVEYLESLGFLAPDVLAAHCIEIDDHELDILARTGAHPIYCPVAHALSGRVQRAWDLLQRGARVLLGTDCACANNVMDLMGELRVAGMAQKQLSGDPTALPAARILEMATVDAAEAIGMGGRLGVLAPGYLADAVMLDLAGLHTTPNYDLLDNVVYCLNGRDVHTVIVNGQVVVRDHRLLTADEAELAREGEARGRALMRRALAREEDLAWLWRSSRGEAL